ncbi:twin-arginine translocation signal domain-containing protein [Deminuibacter soli]|nr:twin-arginine translocation signal domain-containing protein [Deminuibacter soli]
MLNRRRFLRNVGLTGSLLTVPAALLHASPAAKQEGIGRFGNVYEASV